MGLDKRIVWQLPSCLVGSFLGHMKVFLLSPWMFLILETLFYVIMLYCTLGVGLYFIKCNIKIIK